MRSEPSKALRERFIIEAEHAVNAAREKKAAALAEAEAHEQTESEARAMLHLLKAGGA